MTMLLYQYVPLEPKIAAEHIIECFREQNREVMSRKELVDAVIVRHRNAGGELSKDRTYTPTIKKALSILQGESKVEQAQGKGLWRISKQAPELGRKGNSTGNEKPLFADSPCKHLGSGPECIYLYYVPRHALRANEAGKRRWPCKIGYTTGEPAFRLKAQTGSAYDIPKLALVIHTTEAKSFEQLIHLVLTAKKLRHKEAQGKEWYDTNPAEVEKIYYTITDSLCAVDMAPKAAVPVLRGVVQIIRNEDLDMTTLLRVVNVFFGPEQQESIF